MWNLTIYLSLWYFFFVASYGLWVPAGVFVPGMIIGCAVGLLYLEVMIQGIGMNILRVGGQSYLVIGASAMLSSYTRLTYSLAVLMLETTQAINMFLPMLISIIVAHGVARIFNRSLYEYSIRGKQMPLLRNHVPKINEDIRVRDMLLSLYDEGQDLQVVESVCTVQRLSEMLNESFSTVPVVNMHGSLIGMVPKHFIIVLIENHCWYEMSRTKTNVKIEEAYQTSVRRGSEFVFQKVGLKVADESDNMFRDLDVATELAESRIEEFSKESRPNPEVHQAEEPKNALVTTMMKFTGETDEIELPVTRKVLPWYKFNVDFWSNQRSYSEVADICSRFPE